MVSLINVKNYGSQQKGAICLLCRNNVAYYICGQDCVASMGGQFVYSSPGQKSLVYGLTASTTEESPYITCSFEYQTQQISNSNFSKFKASSVAAFEVSTRMNDSYAAFCTINENTQTNGRVISTYSNEATFKIHYCNFVGNILPQSDNGVLISSYQPMEIDNCNFKDNTCQYLFQCDKKLIVTSSYINGNTCDGEIDPKSKDAKIESKSETEIEFKHNYPEQGDEICGFEAAGEAYVPAQWGYEAPPGLVTPTPEPQPVPPQPNCTIVMAPLYEESNPNMTVYTVEFPDGEEPSKDKEAYCTISYRKEPVTRTPKYEPTPFPTIDPNECDEDCQNLKEEKIIKERKKLERGMILGSVFGGLIAGIVLATIITVIIMKHNYAKRDDHSVIVDSIV